jgi:hypothetical protein
MKRIYLFTISALICAMFFNSCSSDNLQEFTAEALQSEKTDTEEPQDGKEVTYGTQEGGDNTDEPVELQGEITYPKYGKFGMLNILADDFVKATRTEFKLAEYSVYADVPVGAGLKIVIRSKDTRDGYHWGGYYPSTVENWHVANY